ncbi:Fe2+-dependent dioxygenase [Sphingorhabdus sp.]|jgi:PKHD-type hydroxylase|uniref:Fe2+-dependent dioxygenase n=1 Tax=Sphingorhabdus sp. TaxID=1902408 RepID=UPI003BAF37F2|nr:Fe2+-dependent dioxygenase [Sphingomonadales bacterium]MBL0022583.1 Fe2+-dependent dioxygenase [Sphingomonadales bacterium]
MLIIIPSVLDHQVALQLGREIAAADWVDGNVTSGTVAALAKRNRQLPEEGQVAARARRVVQEGLARSQLFLSAALPKRIYPPLFNRYGVGEGFGDHIDNAIRVLPDGDQMRTDLSATLFLNDPEEYDDGELAIDSDFGRVAYKLRAGDMLLYPSTSLHHVTEVTRGERIASFFWIESLVQDGAAREALFDLDQSVQALCVERGGTDAQVLRLTKTYHNLIRRWAK